MTNTHTHRGGEIYSMALAADCSVSSSFQLGTLTSLWFGLTRWPMAQHIDDIRVQIEIVNQKTIENVVILHRHNPATNKHNRNTWENEKREGKSTKTSLLVCGHWLLALLTAHIYSCTLVMWCARPVVVRTKIFRFSLQTSIKTTTDNPHIHDTVPIRTGTSPQVHHAAQ